MKTKPETRRRVFASEWDEIGYLHDKVLHWLYKKDDAIAARPFANRLANLLRKADPKQESILGQECWSLVFEAQGDLRRAIKHRENEIRYIRRLHEISLGSPNEKFVLKHYGFSDLSDRLDLLAVLFHDQGNISMALAIVRESKQLCQEHGFPFDGKDLLEEYEFEQRRKNAANGTVQKVRRGRASEVNGRSEKTAVGRHR